MLHRFIPRLTNSTFTYGTHKSQHRLLTINQDSGRLKILRKIYSPLYKIGKGPEWNEMLESGKLWENHFHPFKWIERDYNYQIKRKDLLESIDSLKDSLKVSPVEILQSITSSFAHSSCALEGNTLGLEETIKIWDLMKKNYNMDNLLKNQDISFPLPSTLSNEPESEVIEIRNHLLSNYFLSNLVELEREINLNDIKNIHRIILKDTPKDQYKMRNNEILHAGEFRKVDVFANGRPLTIYPTFQEVFALMERFTQFCNQSIKNNDLHPIMIASRIFSSFLHIHPFIDGNGRVGRSILAYYLIRYGFPPVVFPHDTCLLVDSLFMAQACKDSTFLYDMVSKYLTNVLMNNRPN